MTGEEQRDSGSLRWLVLVALVVATGMVVLSGQVTPGGSALNAAVDLIALAFLLAAVVFAVLSLSNGSFTGPTTFLVRDGAFAVKAGGAYGYVALAQLMLLAFLVRQVTDQWLHPDPETSGLFLAVLLILGTAATTLTAVLAVSLLGRVLVGKPMLELTPAGLLVRDPLGTRMYPWDSLRPGTPARGHNTLKLIVDRPESVRHAGLMRGRRWMHSISMNYALVHSWFFADAVRFYVDHPERRAAIGTSEELDRLLTTLGVPALVG